MAEEKNRKIKRSLKLATNILNICDKQILDIRLKEVVTPKIPDAFDYGINKRFPITPRSWDTEESKEMSPKINPLYK